MPYQFTFANTRRHPEHCHTTQYITHYFRSCLSYWAITCKLVPTDGNNSDDSMKNYDSILNIICNGCESEWCMVDCLPQQPQSTSTTGHQQHTAPCRWPSHLQARSHTDSYRSPDTISCVYSCELRHAPLPSTQGSSIILKAKPPFFSLNQFNTSVDAHTHPHSYMPTLYKI